jgi:hypothetical protein
VVNIFTSLWRKMFPLVLKGTRYPWTAIVDGDDLLVSNQIATWFGGSDDPEDNGSTASGISTKSNPGIIGCALPMDNGKPLSDDNPCQGSPIPKLPWFTTVLVTNLNNGVQVPFKLIDLGPSAPPVAHAAIDLTQHGFQALGGNLDIGNIHVSYRIINGAKLSGLS